MSYRTNRRTGQVFKQIRGQWMPTNWKEYTIKIDSYGKAGEEYDPTVDDEFEREYIYAASLESAKKMARRRYPWAISDFDSGRSEVVEGHDEAIGEEAY